MSLEVLTTVWKYSQARGNSFVVMLAIADNADDETYEAFPSYDHIARKCRISKRTAQDAVRWALDNSELTLVRRGSQGRSNVYCVNVPHLRSLKDQVADPATADSATSDGSPGGNRGGSPLPPNRQSGTISLEPSGETLFPDEASGSGSGTPEGPTPVEQIWTKWSRTFEGKVRLGLTDRRKTMLERALKAVDGDLNICLQAVEGFAAWLAKHPERPQQADIGRVFSTSMHDSRNLTDKIIGWASEVESIGTGEESMPSIVRERITRRKVQVVEMAQKPDDEAAQERGQQALAWLREHAHLEAVVLDGTVTWKEIPR